MREGAAWCSEVPDGCRMLLQPGRKSRQVQHAHLSIVRDHPRVLSSCCQPLPLQRHGPARLPGALRLGRLQRADGEVSAAADAVRQAQLGIRRGRHPGSQVGPDPAVPLLVQEQAVPFPTVGHSGLPDDPYFPLRLPLPSTISSQFCPFVPPPYFPFGSVRCRVHLILQSFPGVM